MTPQHALETLRPGDAALGRLDVLPTLDGMDDGLWALGALAARGVHVLNEPASLLAAHDKLLTARLFRRRSIPHPVTIHVRTDARSRAEVSDRASSLASEAGASRYVDARIARRWSRHSLGCRETAWYRRHGALVQELVPPQGYDLRVLVAAERVVGAVYRVAAEGEWRTNIALGGVRRPVIEPPPEAFALAVAAARATGIALVGVDLLPDPYGGWTVVELNGAVEFSPEYAPWGDVFAEAALALIARSGCATGVRGRRSRCRQRPDDASSGTEFRRRAATLLRARRRSSVG